MINKGTTFLFDWGNTLMYDDPTQQGKMYLWPTVEAVEGAQAALQSLSKHHAIYIATSAQDSKEAEIQKAFQRVGLDQFINGYFCKANLGIEKGSALFYRQIATNLGVSCQHLVMVGDTLEKDIIPAIEAGCQAIYFNPDARPTAAHIQQIQSLTELISKTA